MRTKIFGSCALAALALAACSQQTADQSASQPLAPPSPAETESAPAANALPPAPPAPVRHAPPERRYRALNDAYAMSQTYADAPPDYAFDYDGDAPEAWGSRDGVVRVGERVPGGWRYYYYQPGSGAPYMVRDPDYAYGFEGGQLVVVYDSRGRALPPEYADRQAWLAGRYLVRARDLWRAARERRRMDVEAQVWREQHADQEHQRRYWDETRDADPDWRAYHDQHEGEARDRWAQVAAAWAMTQVAGAQPPPQGGEHHRDGDGGVDAARQAWRARMAQNSGGPMQPPSEGWGGRMPQGPGPAQPPSRGWDGRSPQQNPGGPMQPPPQGWDGRSPQQNPGGPMQPASRGWGPGPAQPPFRGWAGERQAQQQAEAERQRQFQALQQAQADRQHALQAQQQAQADRQRQLQALQQAQADRQHALQAEQQAQADRQRALQVQQQAQADRQRALQVQQQAQADRQRALQVQQQAQAEHQHALLVQQQAQAAHNGKPQDHAPKSDEKPHWPGKHEPDSQPQRQQ